MCRESELGCPAAQISRLASLQFTLGTVEIMEGRVRCMGMGGGEQGQTHPLGNRGTESYVNYENQKGWGGMGTVPGIHVRRHL